MTGYTVVGFWNNNDRRHVVGVIKGEHDVYGGVDVYEGGLFAVYLEADSAEAAEAEVHGSREGDEGESAAEQGACNCPRFTDTGGFRIADLTCPVHGVNGTEPGDGPW